MHSYRLSKMKSQLINSLVSCANCGEKGPFESKSRCSRCRHAYYCNKSCQVADWPNHKRVCGKLDFRVPAMVLPATRSDRYYGVFLPPTKTEALAEIKKILQAENLIERIPVRGDPNLLPQLRLYMDADAKTKSSKAIVNLRAEMILTEFSPAGSVISTVVEDSQTAGDVIAVKFDENHERLLPFNIDDFEAIWGLMALVDRQNGKAAGGIMPKTPHYEKLLGEILKAAMQDRAQLIQQQKQQQQQQQQQQRAASNSQ